VGRIAPRGQCTAKYVPRITTVESRAAGVSPPWYGNAIATVSVHRPPTGRLCATIAIQPLRSRFQNHGWLTPAALGCTCAYCCRTAIPVSESLPVPRGAYAPRSCAAMRMSAGEKTIFAMHKRTCTRAAGVSPPWRVMRTLCGENPALFGDVRTGEQERRVSARRGMVPQLQRCPCTDHRPVASARQLRSSRCDRVSKTTAGSRQPLLVSRAPDFAELRYP
jgi:hypothetical protein